MSRRIMTLIRRDRDRPQCGVLVVFEACVLLRGRAEPEPEPRIVPIRPSQVFPEATSVRLMASDATHKWKSHGELMHQQVRSLRSMFTLLHYDRPPAIPACFIPHHEFVFLDKGGGEVGKIRICFCCGGVEFSKSMGEGEFDILRVDYDRVAYIVHELGAPLGRDAAAARSSP